MIRSLAHNIKQAFIQMVRNRGMSIASIFSITAMLLILGLFFILTVNINLITENAKSQFDTIDVYLLDSTSPEDANLIARSLRGISGVEDVVYVSREEAMEEFKGRWGDKAYLLESLPDNPLPNLLRVDLARLEDGALVAAAARNLTGVEDVKYYDTEVAKIIRISSNIQKGALIIIVFLIFVSIVVVSNTIKLTVLARQEEITIMKCVGATNWFIRGPMLTEGMLIGGISAAIALGATGLFYDRFLASFGDKALILISTDLVEFEFMMVNIIWIFSALGLSIGAVGSMVSMRRFLKA